MKLMLQIVGGVVIGGVLLWYLHPWLAPLPGPLSPPVPPDANAQSLQQLIDLQKRQLAVLQEQIDETRLLQIQLVGQFEQLGSTLNQAISQLQSVATSAAKPMSTPPQAAEDTTAATSLLSEEDQRKEIAWKQYYIAPSECQSMTTREDVIECGNHHIRKRREFETLWEQGAIR